MSASNTVDHQHPQSEDHYHQAEALQSSGPTSPSALSLNFSASFCIPPCAPCALSVSHLSPLEKFGPLEREKGSLWRPGVCRRLGNRSARRSNGPTSPFVSPVWLAAAPPLFISLVSSAGYMLLIKHAARLLIVNQIQFVPGARAEWASPPRTKVSKQPCQSWTKDCGHHLYLPPLEPRQLARQQPLNEALSWQVSRRAFKTCPPPTFLYIAMSHFFSFPSNDISTEIEFICGASDKKKKQASTWVYTQNLYTKYSKSTSFLKSCQHLVFFCFFTWECFWQIVETNK